MVNNRVMVPMRDIFEVLGAEVEWNAEASMVFASKENLFIGLTIGNPVGRYSTDGTTTSYFLLDAAPFIYNNKTMVPVRFVSEALGATVEWNDEFRSVLIYTN